MSESHQQQSPLVQIDLAPLVDNAALTVVEQPFHGHLNLRGRPDNKAFMQAVKKVIGSEPPMQANTWIETKTCRIYWLGPDEWLIVTPPEKQTDLEQRLRKALNGIFSSVTDVSSGQTVIRISGDKARAVLQKGCTLDIHPSVFKVGDCAQSLLAKAGVMISMVDENPTFDLVVRRSFSDYLGLWLLDATHEYTD